MIYLGEEVRDLNYLNEFDLVEIAELDKNNTLPYMCVLRHQDERVFELLRPSADENVSSNRLILNQSMKSSKYNFDRFRVILSKETNYNGWHYNYFSKNRTIQLHFF